MARSDVPAELAAALLPAAHALLRSREEPARRVRDDVDAYLEVALAAAAPDFSQAPVHRVIQAFIAAAWARGLHALAILPMGIGKTLQAVGRLAWEIGRNPDVRSLLVSSAYTTAHQRVAMLEQVLLSARHGSCFGTRPDYARGWSNSTGLFVARKLTAPDPTVRPVGISGQFTGTRLDLLVMDDVIDIDNSILSNSQSSIIDKVQTTALTRLEARGRVLIIGTPYTATDLYAHLSASPRLAVLRAPVAADCECLGPVTCTLSPSEFEVPDALPLPLFLSPPALRARREEIGAVAWARGYMLNPLAAALRWYAALDGALLAENAPEFGLHWHPGAFTIQGVDLSGGSRAGTAIVTLQIVGAELRVVAAQFMAGGFRERAAAILAAGRAHGVQCQIVESNFQQAETIAEVRALGADWPVIAHQTGANKRDPSAGLEAMDVAFANGSLHIYAGAPGAPMTSALRGLARLVEELRVAPAQGSLLVDGRREESELDGVMALWFAWRWAKLRGASKRGWHADSHPAPGVATLRNPRTLI